MLLFPNESYGGNIEYKLHLKYLDENKYEKYATQLKYRVLEGNGQAIYIIGIHDKGYVIGIDKKDIDITIKKINYISNIVQCSIKTILYCECNKKHFLIIKIVANFDINSLPFYIH